MQTIVLLCVLATATASRVLQQTSDLNTYLTSDPNARPTIPGFKLVTYASGNKWSPYGDIPGGCRITWQECVKLASDTPNAAGFVYQVRPAGKTAGKTVHVVVRMVKAWK